MFYTEYRPQKFSELIGADQIVLTITSALAMDKAPHSYFFTGGRGIGKTTTARLLAKALLCQSPKISKDSNVKFEPCGKCKSCKMIENANHLDVIEMDAASNRGIDDIRTLKENINLSPTIGTRKIYIIDEVHMLSNDASNALLKTLEEPPVHAYFVLCTTNPEKVLDTIKSRCVQLVFKRPQITDLVTKIQRIADDKKFKLDEPTANKIATLAKGAYREAETYLEQVINGNLNQQSIVTNDEQNNVLSKYIKSGNISEALNYVQTILNSGQNIEQWAIQYVEYLRSLLFIKAGVTNNSNLLSKIDIELAKEFSISELKNFLQKFTEAINVIRYSPIATLPIEIAIIELGVSDQPVSTQNIPNVSITPKDADVVMVDNSKADDKKTDKVDQKEVEAKTAKSKSQESVSVKAESVVIEEPAKKPAQKSDIEEENKNHQVASSKVFPFKKLLEALKETNHSIYLLLSACKVKTFDGKNLDFSASYSFHKERVMSSKIRTIIEETSTQIIGNQIIIKCLIDEKNPAATMLTDKNVISVKKPPLEDVFQNVFGDGLEILS